MRFLRKNRRSVYTPFLLSFFVLAGFFVVLNGDVAQANHFGAPQCNSWTTQVCLNQSTSVSGSTVNITISTNNAFTEYYFWTYLYATLDGNTQLYNPGTYKLGSGQSHTFTFNNVSLGTHDIGGDANLYWWNGSSWVFGGTLSILTSITVSPPTPPTPTNFQFSPSSGIQGYTTTASWSASSGATEYMYYSSSLGVTSWTSLGNITSVSFSTASIVPGTYWVYLTACNSWGCSNYTNAYFIVNPPPPPTPTNFNFSPSSGVQGFTTTASWSASSGAERYEYYAPSAGVGSWTNIGNVTSISLNTSTLAPATYTFSLRACNSGGCSGSVNASVTVQQQAPSTLSASIIPTTITTVQSATFSWTASSGAANCNVFINNANNGAVSCSGGSQIFPGSNLGIGTHTGYVRACNAGGCVNSNIVTLQVQTRRPPFLRLGI